MASGITTSTTSSTMSCPATTETAPANPPIPSWRGETCRVYEPAGTPTTLYEPLESLLVTNECSTFQRLIHTSSAPTGVDPIRTVPLTEPDSTASGFGETGVDATDAGLEPAALAATTVKVYCTPLVSPEMVQLSTEVVHVSPPGFAATV